MKIKIRLNNELLEKIIEYISSRIGHLALDLEKEIIESKLDAFVYYVNLLEFFEKNVEAEDDPK